MSTAYRVVHLMQNHLYPTYQLHAFMSNKKTTPPDGLRLAALITMDWLRQRLGDHAPEAFLALPDPDSYLTVDDQCLFSIHINAGYVIDIVSLPEDGVWTLQVTEPDLGSDPGNPDQRRQAVPGRVIETNIAYKIVGQKLDCGFQTMVSDPEGTQDLAEVYRLAIIRQLIAHPDFGLEQLTYLTHDFTRLTTLEQVKTLQSTVKDDMNAIPCVVFSQTMDAALPEIGLSTLPVMSASHTSLFSKLPPAVKPSSPQAKDPPYDIATFARSCVTYCRVYLLDHPLLERFSRLFSLPLDPGDIAVLEPFSFGGKAWKLPFKPNKQRQDETLAALKNTMLCYPREKQVSFGSISFLSAARENLLHSTADALNQSRNTADKWAQKMADFEAAKNIELQQKVADYEALMDQLDRQRQYTDRLAQEKDALRAEKEAELSTYKLLLEKKDEDIAYLKRKLSQPKEHLEIADWVNMHFSGRLVLHQKAVSLLADKSARSVNIGLICDALDFLATDYWSRRYQRISTDEMNRRCSEKYGRPFEVKPTGATTIEFTPKDYKIKYFPGALGKPVESPLDFHLGVGNDPENLLRIYFLHDDDKKLIVVGSLPRHLRAVSIK